MLAFIQPTTVDNEPDKIVFLVGLHLKLSIDETHESNKKNNSESKLFLFNLMYVMRLII